jgi:hypothetical protein
MMTAWRFLVQHDSTMGLILDMGGIVVVFFFGVPPGKVASASVRRVGRTEVAEVRTWSAHRADQREARD